ncbi:hypothetical protein QCM77_12615 [Bradyrhizobium sp. SSUT18]|uniref:hypothetical protein n=1 Tax=Bradyrhizobium sp. SSUT18 TaxID=3040602 RepID=UPI00244B5C90|nr:hypothetical protein [Bradyrhizobium sp. SSUT18]MDH2400778.1 hypothetical protein [Bradyrhizobium sp. SSUT18]
MIALMLQSSLTIPTINTSTVIYTGSTSGQATVGAQAVAGTPSIKWPTTSGTVPTTATTPILLDAVTGVISCPTCATSTAAASPIVASRALAQTLNLSSFTGLVTVGYAASGDGGGATFKKITSGNFIDSFVATGSVSAAGTCSTNGTFYGVSPTGGTGGKLQGIVVIAGGVMTSFTPTGSKGNAYTAGNALTIPNGSYNGSTLTCSVSPQWTVATVTTPSASFTDSVGTKFQYVVDNGNFPNVRQFGAKLDRAGKANDGLATNDQAAVQNALNFTGYGVSNVDTGGYAGGKVIVPAGTALICNGLMVPFSVKLSGVSNSGTTLKQCDAGRFHATVHHARRPPEPPDGALCWH